MDCAYRIRGVLFDFDGTLTTPGAIDFPAIKAEIGCPPDQPVLEYIATETDGDARRRALDILDRHEMAAAAASAPRNGMEKLVVMLRERNIPVGIASRNSHRAIERALANFKTLTATDFDPIISRDTRVAPKPDPASVQMAARHWQLSSSEILVVGDFHFDITAGRRAGAMTALLSANHDFDPAATGADFIAETPETLTRFLVGGLPLAAGKLPNTILERMLAAFAIDDPSVIVGAGVGEDIAAVTVKKNDVLTLKSDPITFATDAIGRYAVTVNANDIATAGARPRWFLTTLLFPVGTTPSWVEQTMAELHATCRDLGITLCGGHTEITDAVGRSVITGMMVGTVPRDRLIQKRGMRPGDVIVMTKAVAVEGTAILCRECADRLMRLGFNAADLDRGRAFLDRISILPEAGIAAQTTGVSAMHDVTEGGLATALAEFGQAGGCRLQVEMERISVDDLTRRLCEGLDIDPLGLIGSGSLLIACRAGGVSTLLERLKVAGIAAVAIGKAVDGSVGIEAVRDGVSVTWPTFAVDEITRLF